MDEEQKRKPGVPMLIKKGHMIPENAYPMSDLEVMETQRKRINSFKPQSEMRVMQRGTHILSAVVGLSGILLNSTVRKNFRLGGLRRMFTYVPSVVLPTAFSEILHEVVIKPSILLGREPCPVCVSLRSGVLQVSMGLVYPLVISFLTCLPIARENYTLSQAAAARGTGYLRLIHHVLPKPSILLFVGISNMFVGMMIANKELGIFHKHLSKPPSSDALQDAELLAD